MFLNLSNHPSAEWPAEQLAAASAWGEVVDLTFPNIPPEWDTAQVAALARDYFDRIKLLLADASGLSAVHVMGESVFTLRLVVLLQSVGIRAVASTTSRTVSYQGSAKTSTFDFVRFREY
jgi:hypothetical protein